jgi:hypothetical protein
VAPLIVNETWPFYSCSEKANHLFSGRSFTVWCSRHGSVKRIAGSSAASCQKRREAVSSQDPTKLLRRLNRDQQQRNAGNVVSKSSCNTIFVGGRSHLEAYPCASPLSSSTNGIWCTPAFPGFEVRGQATKPQHIFSQEPRRTRPHVSARSPREGRLQYGYSCFRL